MSYVERTHPENVVDPKSYMDYVCQTVGTPWCMQDLHVMRKKSRLFFEQYPQCGWPTLVRVAQWARAKKKRPARAFYVVDYARYAWTDGAVPEMDPSNVDYKLEARIRLALDEETDASWRERLTMSEGDGRRETYKQWNMAH